MVQWMYFIKGQLDKFCSRAKQICNLDEMINNEPANTLMDEGMTNDSKRKDYSHIK